jgi:hypothetical protein
MQFSRRKYTLLGRDQSYWQWYGDIYSTTEYGLGGDLALRGRVRPNLRCCYEYKKKGSNNVSRSAEDFVGPDRPVF